VSLDCEPVKRTAANVQVRVGGAEDEEQDASVEETRKATDTSHRDGDDKGTGFGGGGSLVGCDELRRVVGNDHAE